MTSPSAQPVQQPAQPAPPQASPSSPPAAGGFRIRSKAATSETSPRTPSVPPVSELASSNGSAGVKPDDPLAGHTSTRSPGGKSLDAGIWKDLFRGLVEQLTNLLHQQLATTEKDVADGLWLADEEDQSKIAGPLANLAHRRAELPGGDDAADLIKAGAALTAYALRNSGKAFRNRRNARRAKAALNVPDPVEHPS